MKHLSQFLKFEDDRFFKEKQLICTGVKPWYEYIDNKKTDVCLGTAVQVVITDDKTAYEQKDGETVTNRFEKLSVKVAKNITVPVDATVELVNPVCRIYGDYRNQLGVHADDVQVVTANTTTSSSYVSRPATDKPALQKKGI